MSNKEIFESKFAAMDTFTARLYPMVIDVIEEREGFVLQRSTDNKTGNIKFRLFWDGECISTLADEKEARSLLNDFCPIQKKRGRKKAA